MKPEIDEYAMALKARDGDAVALSTLSDHLRCRLFSIALADLRNYDDAQDATANALVRICAYIGTLREPDRLRAWADGILRNEVRRLAANRRPSLPLADFDAFGGEVESSALMRVDIRRALRRLPDVQSHALRMFYLDGTPVADIASDTGKPIGTVKSWLHHGRKRLQTFLEEYGPMMTQVEQTTAPLVKRALLVQATITTDLMERLAKGLHRRGYELYNPTEQDLENIINSYASFDTDKVKDWLREFDAFIFDETPTPVPTIAQIINVRAEPELRHIPIFVLIDDPLDSGPWEPTVEYYSRFSMSCAYFNAGVDGVIVKSDPKSDDLQFSDERAVVRWDRMTARAGLVFKQALAEAIDHGSTSVTPEHVLIGITNIPECLGAVLLAQYNGVALERLRETVIGRLTPEFDADAKIEFDDLTYEMLRQAQAEANSMSHSWLGAEHFLAGILRQPETPACTILTESGLTLSRLREQIPELLKRQSS